MCSVFFFHSRRSVSVSQSRQIFFQVNPVMFESVFQNLVQYSDDLQNQLRPSLNCDVLANLERLHLSHLNPSNYGTQTFLGRIDLSPPLSMNSSIKATLDVPDDPLACLSERLTFQFCPKTVANEITTVSARFLCFGRMQFAISDQIFVFFLKKKS